MACLCAERGERAQCPRMIITDLPRHPLFFPILSLLLTATVGVGVGMASTPLPRSINLSSVGILPSQRLQTPAYFIFSLQHHRHRVPGNKTDTPSSPPASQSRPWSLGRGAAQREIPTSIARHTADSKRRQVHVCPPTTAGGRIIFPSAHKCCHEVVPVCSVSRSPQQQADSHL